MNYQEERKRNYGTRPMQKTIQLMSFNSARHDIFVLPPDGGHKPLSIEEAVEFVDEAIKEVKQALGEDIDGETAKRIMDILEQRGFTVLDPQKTNENWDA